MNEIIILIITNILSPIIVGFATFFLTKRKYSAEVENTLILNLRDSLNFYQEIVKDNLEKLLELLEKNDVLEKKDDVLEKKVEDLKRQINLLYLISCIKNDCPTRIPHSCMLKNKLDEMYSSPNN